MGLKKRLPSKMHAEQKRLAWVAGCSPLNLKPENPTDFKTNVPFNQPVDKPPAGVLPKGLAQPRQVRPETKEPSTGGLFWKAAIGIAASKPSQNGNSSDFNFWLGGRALQFPCPCLVHLNVKTRYVGSCPSQMQKMKIGGKTPTNLRSSALQSCIACWCSGNETRCWE